MAVWFYWHDSFNNALARILRAVVYLPKYNYLIFIVSNLASILRICELIWRFKFILNYVNFKNGPE